MYRLTRLRPLYLILCLMAVLLAVFVHNHRLWQRAWFDWQSYWQVTAPQSLGLGDYRVVLEAQPIEGLDEVSALTYDPLRYDRVMEAVLVDQGAAMDEGRRIALRKAWGLRRGMGKPLNVARLMKAAFTFQGASRYAAWKIQRHTGVAIEITPWRERHPILAAPGVLLKVWNSRRG